MRVRKPKEYGDSCNMNAFGTPNIVTTRYNPGRLRLWSPNVFVRILMIDQMGRVRKYKRWFRSLTLRPYIRTILRVTS
ncbi:hypothetical protein HanIR_Chr15g0761631 [Helianthus annuus]|nr:hypothetical protein HanIR_Chr15g0761631 [Helianthus annuus]